MKSRFSISACFLVLVLLAMAPASGLTVSNIALVAAVSPGDQVVYNMTVDVGNVSGPVDVSAELTAFTHNLKGERVEIPHDEPATYSARDFLKVTPERATIEPGEKKVFTIEGAVPEDVGDGVRYALVEILTVPDPNDTVGFSSEVEVPIVLTIKGSEIIETGEITELNVSKGDDGGLEVEIMFNNTGNNLYKTEANIVLKDGEGTVVDEAAISSGSASILPLGARLCNVQIASDTYLQPGTYTVEVSVMKRGGMVLATKEATIEV